MWVGDSWASCPQEIAFKEVEFNGGGGGKMHDLAEHTGTLLCLIGALVALSGSLLSAIGYLIWAKLVCIEEKVDQSHALHSRCREELPVRFATKEELKDHQHDFKKWQEGRDDLWDALNDHQHDANGRVVR